MRLPLAKSRYRLRRPKVAGDSSIPGSDVIGRPGNWLGLLYFWTEKKLLYFWTEKNRNRFVGIGPTTVLSFLLSRLLT